MEQKLIELKEEIDNSTIITEDLNISFLIMENQTEVKLGNRGLDQCNKLTISNRCIQDTLPINNRIQILSSSHRTFCRIDHMLDNKLSLNRFKKTYIV